MKKKILILTPYLPWPLNSGGNVGVFYMLSAICVQHDVFFVTSYNRFNDYKKLRMLQAKLPNVHFFMYDYRHSSHKVYEYLRKIVRQLFKRMYWDQDITSLSYSLMSEVTPGYVEYINQIIKIKDIEIVQIEFCDYLPFVYYLPETVKKIFIHHELRFVRDELNFADKDLGYSLCQYRKDNEISMLNHFDIVVSLTEIDKKKLYDAGVNARMECSTLAISDRTQNFISRKCNDTLSFVGSPLHTPNFQGLSWFLTEVFPLIQKNRNWVNLNIIGSWSESYRNEIHKINPNVNFGGFVDDLSIALDSSLMIVPINIGSGMRMKILEAANYSVPFVSTEVGAEGLLFENGKDCFISNSAEDMADKILRVLDDSSLYESLAASAHKVFEEHYSFEALTQKRLSLYL